jgi:hypothetical protein
MKKRNVLWLLLLVVLIPGLGSCKKNWTCTCNYTDGTPYEMTPFEDVNKKKAKELCDQVTLSIASDSILCTVE